MQHDLTVVIAVVLLQVGIPLNLFTIPSSGLLSCFPIVEQSASSWYILPLLPPSNQEYDDVHTKQF